jgi:hypothetical protein
MITTVSSEETVVIIPCIAMCPTGIKSEGEIKLPIAIPCAPAYGSGDGGI